MTQTITSPFTFETTALDVVDGVDLTGKRAIVTGASSGIGIETARALAAAGAQVTLAVRNLEAGRSVAADISTSTGNEQLTVSHLDLADLAAVDRFVADWSGALHILVNNAGVMAAPRERTRDGWELHFQTNYLGHFRLAHGLHDSLAAAGGRIVSVSSAGNLISPVIFDDINFDYRPYDPMLAYGQSKTADALFAVAADHWSSDGILTNAIHPGNIAATALPRFLTPDMFARLDGFVVPPEKNLQQGAATSVFAAASPLLDGVAGEYFEDCRIGTVLPSSQGWASGVAPYALDAANAERLWQLSTDWIEQTAGKTA